MNDILMARALDAYLTPPDEEPPVCSYCDEVIPFGQKFWDIYDDAVCGGCLERWLEDREREA